MRSVRLLLVSLVLLSLSACDTTADLARLDVSTLSHDPVALVGSWDLATVTSSGFGGPVETTPASALEWSEAFTFRADGTVDVFRDGALVETTTYTVEIRSDGTLSPSLRIGGSERYRREYFGVTADRLYFDYRPADGPLVEFARR